MSGSNVSGLHAQEFGQDPEPCEGSHQPTGDAQSIPGITKFANMLCERCGYPWRTPWVRTEHVCYCRAPLMRRPNVTRAPSST